MDRYDRRIAQALAADARVSLKDLAQAVHLSPPSVAERLKRLEERGVILRYTAEIEPRALGFALQAIVRVRPLPGRSSAVESVLEAIPEICECDKVTGDDCFVVRLYVRSIDQLDELLRPIADLAETSTAIVKSQPIKRRQPPIDLST